MNASGSRRLWWCGLVLLVGGVMGPWFVAQSLCAQDEKEAIYANEMPDYERPIEFFLRRVKGQPKDPTYLVQLAQRYARKARETGAEECYALAEESLKKALEINPKDPAARLSMSGVLCFRHQFAAGLKLAEEVYAEQPDELDALGSIHDAQMGLGDDVAAGKSLEELTKRIKGSVTGLWIRQAHFAELHGRDDEALKLVKQCIPVTLEGRGDHRTPGMVWYQLRLGHQLLEMGQVEPAVAEFEDAVKRLPGYFLAMSGLAEARAAQGRLDEALKLYAKTIALCPDPLFHMAVGDIYTKLGQADQAKAAYATAEKTILESGATPAEYSRELSLFYSERGLQPKKAVELARIDLTFRRDIFGHDALAWALYRDGQFEEAAKASQQALRTGSRSAKLHYHAGMIQHRLGNVDAARKYLTHATTHQPAFSVLDADLARQTLKELSK
ncbi:MAG: tetratricopeptide repeat protein [Planctomycetaceae bacterium]